MAYSGDTKSAEIGGNTVVLKRSDRLNYYGNPVHSATIIDKNGDCVGFSKSSGSATLVVKNALKKSGVDVKYKKHNK